MSSLVEKRKTSARRSQNAETSATPVVDRVPPHNLDAEQGLLASCIIDGGGDILSQCLSKKVSAEYFFSAAHQLIFRAIVELSMAGTGVDEITVCEALRITNSLEAAGGPVYINELTNRIEVTAHAIHWMEIVREKYFLRKLISTATLTVERAFKPNDDLDHLLDSVEKSFFEISQDRITDSAQHVKGPMKEAVEMVNFLHDNKGAITGVPTGFPDLDKMCFGFHPGQMIVVAARPGMGKTSIALNFIEAALFPKDRPAIPTLMFSLEMPSRELAMRLLCSRSRVDLRRVRDGFVDKQQLKDIVDTAGEYHNIPLFIDDQGGQNILEIRAKCRRLCQQNKLGLIIIDYLQLINGTDNAVSREQQIAEASRSIKAMSKEFSLPIVALAQLNRKSEDENRAPRMSDLRESGSIEQDADMVMLIDKKRRGKRTAKDGEEEDIEINPGVVERELIIAKQRNGPTGEIPLLFNRSLTRFESPAHSHGSHH
ncbi:MAG: replicative DNA helicase [Puniceicoccales bacterium]|jgi:replicative DNA helicase|nr:replicative DNA helicase [Puniceicoccales bacterium]